MTIIIKITIIITMIIIIMIVIIIRIVIIIVIIIIIIMLSRYYASTLDHAQPAELCMGGCGYTMTPDFT